MELWASFSPDSGLIAYTVGETDRFEVYIAPVPRPPDNHAAPPLKVSRNGGLQPQWSPNGKELFYLSGDYRRILSVDVASRPSLSVGEERVVLESIPRALPWALANFRVATDGERFLVLLPNEEERQQLLVVITDWRNELRRLGVAK